MSHTPVPSRNEDEYFVKQDAHLIRQLRHKLDVDRDKLERTSHYMHCPKCGAVLSETEFHHVKIDKCLECGGIWFDKGETQLLEHLDQSKIRAFVRSLFGLHW